MSIIKYNDVVIGANGWGITTTGISALNASINFSNNLQPLYAIGQANAVSVVPNGPIQGTASLSYYLTGADPLYTAFTYAAAGGNLTTPMTVGWGNVVLTGCYLKSYSASASQNQVAQASVEFGVYMTQWAGTAVTAGTAGTATNSPIGHGANTAVTYDGAAVSDSLSFNLQGTNSYEETYILGQSTPVFPLVRSSSVTSLTLVGYNLAKAITICGTDATGVVTLNDLCGGGAIQAYTVTGKVGTSNLTVDAGGAVQGEVQIISYTY